MISPAPARACASPPRKAACACRRIVGTNKGIDELVIADGVSRSITDPECKGNEQAEWSKDDARVFRTTNVTCGKDPARTIKTVTFMAPGPALVHVQHVIGDSANASVRVQRLSPRRQPEAGRRQHGAAARQRRPPSARQLNAGASRT